MSTTSASMPSTAIDRSVARLREAARTHSPCHPVRDLIGADTASAYAVQQRGIADQLAGGARIVGRKIGLTSPAVQQQLGVDQPDFGVLLDTMQRRQDLPISTSDLLQPKVEAEVAFVLGRDLVGDDLSPLRVREAVEYAVAALEIVDSRIAGWDITFADTVADNASSGLFVLGSDRVTLDDFRPVSVEMEMLIDGECVSSGNGAACLGDPLNALSWLAVTARDFGRPLLAGQIVLSGALGPMAPISRRCAVQANITGLGTVSADFQ